MDFVFLKELVVSLGLGLLVGFQREWGPPHVAGIRSFALIAVLGTICARLGNTYGGWLVSAGLIAVTALVIAGGIAKYYSKELTPGITTGAAALLIYVVGALVVDYLSAAIIVGGVTAVLLHWKKPLHEMVHKATASDIQAIFQLVLIALVILPILPNRSYGPYAVLNPFHIWLMVVLIVGISLVGYIASRFLGAGTGASIAGILGGIISSTATTASFSKRSRDDTEIVSLSAFVILVASTIAFFRVAFEIGVVAPQILPRVLPQLMTMTAVMVVLCGGFYVAHLRHRKWQAFSAAAEPSNMKMALVFGLLYAVILFAVAAAKEQFGHKGLYIIAGLSGLTDMDAITLSTTQLLKQQRIDIDTGWRMILIGALFNLVFKGGIAAVLGSRQLIRHVGVYFSLAILGGACMIAFWP
jgi:uncharacterized membrane protein (DUF4010 family)